MTIVQRAGAYLGHSNLSLASTWPVSGAWRSWSFHAETVGVSVLLTISVLSNSFPRNQEVYNKRMSGRHYVKSPSDSSLARKQPAQDRNASEGPPAETSRALRRARCTVEEASPRDHFGSLFASVGAARTPISRKVNCACLPGCPDSSDSSRLCLAEGTCV